MSKPVVITANLPERCNIKSVSIRETTGVDERNAALAAEAKKTATYPELIRLAIVAVDGQPVSPPGAVDFDNWNSRTRKAVGLLFDRINDVAAAEMDPLFEGMTMEVADE